jgi:hypothetical protein
MKAHINVINHVLDAIQVLLVFGLGESAAYQEEVAYIFDSDRNRLEQAVHTVGEPPKDLRL